MPQRVDEVPDGVVPGRLAEALANQGISSCIAAVGVGEADALRSVARLLEARRTPGVEQAIAEVWRDGRTAVLLRIARAGAAPVRELDIVAWDGNGRAARWWRRMANLPCALSAWSMMMRPLRPTR